MSATRAKEHEQSAVKFDALIPLVFPVVALASSQSVNTVQARIWLPTSVKIYRIIAGLSGTVAGSCAVQVVAGTANPAGTLPTPDTDYAGQPAYPPAYATAGQQLLQSPAALTMTADLATVINAIAAAGSGYPANTPGQAFDGLWGPGGQELTLRTVTGASTTGNLAVSLLCKFYDPTYNKPVLTGFNPVTDIP
jgi:hypothetical protein